MSQDDKLVDVVSSAAQDIGGFIRAQREAATQPSEVLKDAKAS